MILLKGLTPVPSVSSSIRSGLASRGWTGALLLASLYCVSGCAGEVNNAADQTVPPAAVPEQVGSPPPTPGVVPVDTPVPEDAPAPGVVPEDAPAPGVAPVDPPAPPQAEACLTGTLPPVAEVPARLLSGEELTTAIRQLLPEATIAPIVMALDGRVDTFVLNAREAINENHVRDIRAMAEQIAEQVSSSGAFASNCEGATQEQACSATAVVELAKKAYRRPLEESESAGLTALHSAGFEAGGHRAALRYSLEAVLQSPSFIYLHEQIEEAPPALTGYEIAQRMSSVLTRSLPDAALTQSAEAGELTDPSVREAHARRLLSENSGRMVQRRFVSQWLGLDLLREKLILEDGAPATLPDSMLDESRRLIDDVMQSRGAAWPELLTTPYTFVDEDLAAHYDVDLSGAQQVEEGIWKVAIAGRQGLLTQANFLALNHGAIHRGLTVRNSLLCGVVPGPVGIDIEAIATTPTESERSKAEKRLAEPGCGGCHRLMDPLGLAFDVFDDAGRSRTEDSHGNAIHGGGELFGTRANDGPIDGPTELMDRLAQAVEVRACMAKKLFVWSFARLPSAADRCHIESLTQVLEQSGDDLNEALVTLVKEPSFAMRKGEAQ